MNTAYNAEAMKEYAKKMSLCMGIMMSLSLTAIGLISANAFTPVSFLFNFGVSFGIMSIVGRFFDAGMISMNILQKNGIDRGSLKGRLIQSLIIDLVYSPIMTFVMITLSYLIGKSQSVKLPPYIPMLIRGLLVSFVAAFFLCLIFTPIFEKILMKKAVDEK